MQTERHVKTLNSIQTSIKSLAESLSTSLGPRGCDKMIIGKEMLITNDGATILKNFKYHHPINQLLQSVSSQMDSCCGDGTTSIVLLIGSLINELCFLVHKNVKTTFLVKVLDEIKEDCLRYIDSAKFFMQEDGESRIANTNDVNQGINVTSPLFIKSCDSQTLPTKEAVGYPSMTKHPLDIGGRNISGITSVSVCSKDSIPRSEERSSKSGDNDISSQFRQDYETLTLGELLAQCQTSEVSGFSYNRDFLLQSVNTALNSKVINQCLAEYAPIAVDACLQTKGNLSLIKICKQKGSMEDVCLKKSIILSKNMKNFSIKKDAKVFTKKSKIAILQFCLSPPKPNLDYKVDVKDAESIMKIPLEEREYLIDICQKIKKSGTDVVLIQKSLLRDSLSDLALNFLTKLDIIAVDGLERDEISYLCATLKIKPSVEPNSIESAEYVFMETIDNKTVTTEILTDNACAVIVKGSDTAILDEAERSLHDALCVVRCLLEEPYLVTGGGSIEAGISAMLSEKSDKILRSRCSENIHEQFEKSLSINNKTSPQNNEDKISNQSPSNQHKTSQNQLRPKNGENFNHSHTASNDLAGNKSNSVMDLISSFENTSKTPKTPQGNFNIIQSQDKSQYFGRSLVYERIAMAFSQIPYYLAYNAGMDATQTVSELLSRIQNEKTLGINTRIEDVSCMRAENVIQPAKISKHLVSLAIETAQTIIKIDDILPMKE